MGANRCGQIHLREDPHRRDPPRQGSRDDPGRGGARGLARRGAALGPSCPVYQEPSLIPDLTSRTTCASATRMPTRSAHWAADARHPELRTRRDDPDLAPAGPHCPSSTSPARSPAARVLLLDRTDSQVPTDRRGAGAAGRATAGRATGRRRSLHSPTASAISPRLCDRCDRAARRTQRRRRGTLPPASRPACRDDCWASHGSTRPARGRDGAARSPAARRVSRVQPSRAAPKLIDASFDLHPARFSASSRWRARARTSCSMAALLAKITAER